MSDNRYNGWTNYETWNVALWHDNEEGSYRHWRDMIEELVKDHFDLDDMEGTRDKVIDSLADSLQNDAEENLPEVSGFYADILSAALSDVNWHEIAENWTDESFEEHWKECVEDSLTANDREDV